MKSRLSAVAVLSLGVTFAAHTLEAQGARRYRLELRTTAIQDLSAVGQGEQKQEFALSGQVRVTATDSAGGQAVAVVVDSLQASAGSPLPAEMVAGLVGTTWTGFRAPNGRVAELKTAAEVPGGQLVEGALMQLFPPITSGTPAGKAWTDTLDTDQGGLGVRTVTNFQTTDDTHANKKAVRLAGASSSAISGVQESPQGSLSVEGTATSTVSWLIAADGTVVTGTFAQDQALEITVPALPAPIPVKIHNEGTSTVVP
jgi:hypothetical protein